MSLLRSDNEGDSGNGKSGIFLGAVCVNTVVWVALERFIVGGDIVKC